MPNWVYNSLYVTGNTADLQAMKAQLNSPVTTYHLDFEYESLSPRKVKTDENGNAIREQITYTYNNPVFSFMNVVAPTDLAAYYGDETFKPSGAYKADGTFDNDVFMQEFARAMNEDNDWYHWNCRNWGTKWDIGNHDGEGYRTTECDDEGDRIQYRFETAWSPVFEVLEKLSAQYPNLTFDYSYEEEQGWGGEAAIQNGVILGESEYDIPSSHADYVERDQECVCMWYSNDEEPYYPFDDCPRVDEPTLTTISN